jgi:hypothetical protein
LALRVRLIGLLSETCDGDRDYWGLRDLADLVTVVRGAWEVAFFEGARRAIKHRLRTGTDKGNPTV